MNAAPQKTKGLSPKVPAQAFATIATFILARYGIDLGTEESAAIATLIGFAGGILAPPGTAVVSDPVAPPRGV